MITFSAKIQRFARQGEKTGWTYIAISQANADKMNPGCRKSFRVKGMLDSFKIQKVSLLPMGDGSFILPFNADMRKGTGKDLGDTLKVSLAHDAPPKTMDFSSEFTTTGGSFTIRLVIV